MLIGAKWIKRYKMQYLTYCGENRLRIICGCGIRMGVYEIVSLKNVEKNVKK